MEGLSKQALISVFEEAVLPDMCMLSYMHMGCPIWVYPWDSHTRMGQPIVPYKYIYGSHWYASLQIYTSVYSSE